MTKKLNIKATEIKQLGKWDKEYGCWRQTDEERKRPDIEPERLYLVVDRNALKKGYWLLGEFRMMPYGWIFEPHYGSMHMQIEHLNKIFRLDIPRATLNPRTKPKFILPEVDEDDYIGNTEN